VQVCWIVSVLSSGRYSFPWQRFAIVKGRTAEHTKRYSSCLSTPSAALLMTAAPRSHSLMWFAHRLCAQPSSTGDVAPFRALFCECAGAHRLKKCWGAPPFVTNTATDRHVPMWAAYTYSRKNWVMPPRRPRRPHEHTRTPARVTGSGFMLLSCAPTQSTPGKRICAVRVTAIEHPLIRPVQHNNQQTALGLPITRYSVYSTLLLYACQQCSAIL
jgi:hypothetical protein